MSNETIATETTEAVGELPIDELLSDGITNTPPSFVRAILAAASDPAVTSFAGGLPNPISFPQEALLESMQRVVAERGADAFQYSATAGIEGLRDWIARRYNKRFGTDYTADDVLITTGSQQILDLLGKVLLDKGDGVIVEKPTYLAAIQAFALNQPTFHEVELTEDGLNIDELNAALDAGADKAGFEDLIKEVSEGFLDFDVAIATTSAMKEVRKVARVLGPKGLMPNPKSGTVTDDVASAIAEVKAGRVEFKMDKTSNMSVVVGKRSFATEKLAENAKVVLDSVVAARPEAIKGKFINSIAISSTMSPSVKIALSEVAQ